MSISLVKGQKIDLTKGNSGLRKVAFGLGWDTNRYDGNSDFDLDVSAFLTDDTGKVTSEKDFVFYGQPQHPSGALIYSGDNRTGEGDGDDETMIVDLNKIPSNITKSVSLQQYMMQMSVCRISVWLITHISELMMSTQMRNCLNMN